MNIYLKSLNFPVMNFELLKLICRLYPCCYLLVIYRELASQLREEHQKTEEGLQTKFYSFALYAQTCFCSSICLSEAKPFETDT